MTVFWILTGLATALAGLLVLTGARRGASAEPPAEAGAVELAELDRLLARGLLDAEAHALARAEAGRRLLAAGPEAAAPVPGAHDRQWVLAGVGLTAAAALGLYLGTGSLGLPDQPYQKRVAEWAAGPLETLEPAQLAAVVEQRVKAAPGDRTALTFLGVARFEAGDPIGAASAFRRALAIDPNDAQSWARLGESLVRANDGVVGTDAEAAFREAINRDPDQLGARYFLGEAALARGDGATVRAMWGPLIAVLDPRDPRRADLIARLPPETAP